MNVAVTGASGFVGRRLAVLLEREGHNVRSISIRPASLPAALEGFDAVVHLAGEPVAQQWTPAARNRIRSSRIEGTKALVQALSAHPPKVLVSASAVGYYGSRGDEVLAERSAPGTGFLAEVARGWEQEATAAEKLGTRVVCLRIGVVLGKGGALARMLPPFRLGLGGRLGSGKQWTSWIHREDLCRLVSFAFACEEMRGPVNGTSPQPLTNAQFTRALAKALHRPAILPVPEFALNLVLGKMSEIVLGSQRVIPEVALRTGFEYRFPEIDEALRDVLSAP